MRDVLLSASLNWRQIAAVAEGARLELAPEVRDRIVKARGIVDALVARGSGAPRRNCTVLSTE